MARKSVWARSIGAALLVTLAAAAGASSAAPPAPPTYAVTAHIPGPDGFWDYVSFEPVKRRVYSPRRRPWLWTSTRASSPPTWPTASAPIRSCRCRAASG